MVTTMAAMLMAVEIRVFPAMDAFRQKSGTVLAAAWMLFLSTANQVLDPKCKSFGIGFSVADSIPVTTNADAAKHVFWQPKLRGFASPLTRLR